MNIFKIALKQEGEEMKKKNMKKERKKKQDPIPGHPKAVRGGARL